MTKEKEMLEDPKNLEMIIRQELGYIRPGEVIYQEPEVRGER
jgi:cell division protein FtsB